MHMIRLKKILISSILSTGILLSTPPLFSSTMTSNLQTTQPILLEHRQTITDFIDRLSIVQNRIYRLLQIALDYPIQDIAGFKTSINLVNTDAEALRRDILDYQRTLLSSSFQYRDVLFLLNALNYTKNSLFELELLSVATDNVDRARILQNFFISRAEGINTLGILDNILLESYN